MKLLKITSICCLLSVFTSIAYTPQHNLRWFTQQETKCLVQNVYHEARGESLPGQIAVTKVLLNRAHSHGRSLCASLYQPKQFSWTSSPKKRRTTPDIMPYLPVLYQAKLSDFEATHYHATYVNPTWAKKMTLVAKIDNHIFYK